MLPAGTSILGSCIEKVFLGGKIISSPAQGTRSECGSHSEASSGFQLPGSNHPFTSTLL